MSEKTERRPNPTLKEHEAVLDQIISIYKSGPNTENAKLHAVRYAHTSLTYAKSNLGVLFLEGRDISEIETERWSLAIRDLKDNNWEKLKSELRESASHFYDPGNDPEWAEIGTALNNLANSLPES